MSRVGDTDAQPPGGLVSLLVATELGEGSEGAYCMQRKGPVRHRWTNAVVARRYHKAARGRRGSAEHLVTVKCDVGWWRAVFAWSA